MVHWQPKIPEHRLYKPGFYEKKEQAASMPKKALTADRKLAPVPNDLVFTNKIHARAFELVNDAAENGLTAPTNEELSNFCHTSHANTISKILKSLAVQGHIRTEKVNGCSRRFLVLHSGKKTLPSGGNRKKEKSDVE